MQLTWVWDLSVGEGLHEEDAVGPDVRLDGELAEGDGLGRSPLHREPRARLRAVLVVHDHAGKPKVSHLKRQTNPL